MEYIEKMEFIQSNIDFVDALRFYLMSGCEKEVGLIHSKDSAAILGYCWDRLQTIYPDDSGVRWVYGGFLKHTNSAMWEATRILDKVFSDFNKGDI